MSLFTKLLEIYAEVGDFRKRLRVGEITLPIFDGTSGQVMTTDGKGKISFTDKGGVGGFVGYQEFIATEGQTEFIITDFTLGDVYLCFRDDTKQRPILFTRVGQTITSIVPFNQDQVLEVYG